MIGDVVGEPGLQILEECLPPFLRENSPDFIMINGENAAAGFGLNPDAARRILALGIDIISGGNHIWEKRDFLSLLDSKEVLRPANYPDGNPGKGWAVIEKTINGKSKKFIAINLQGRELMSPIDCPFLAFDKIHSSLGETAQTRAPVILVDFHAESTREKEALGHYIDGRASVLAGTHTHVQTADEKILPNGTAYITDLGMTGIADGVIGMEPETCIQRARKQVLYRMEAAEKGQKKSVQGIIAEIDAETAKAARITRFNLS